ncbi:MAG: flagellar hook-associated protein FlgL [Acidobacteriota bacterium]|nr:flagellar hook-associated protein FlgL [Acidobacteriota bacterium]
MGLRIAPNLYSTLLYGVTNDRENLNTDLQQISSGKSVNLPSDNPAATASYIGDQAESGSNDAFQHSISTVQGALSTADSALGSVINNLNQALSLGVEGANGTNSPSELQGMAQEVQSIQQTVLALANTSYQGAYLFAGTNVTAAPYAVSGGSPSGVSYAGNADTNTIQVGPGQFVGANLPGSTIFNSAGADVFQALHDLSAALNTNTNIKGALSELTTAFNAVNSQRTFYGNTLDQLTSVNSSLTQEQLTLSQQEGNLISADTAKAASNLAQDQTSLQGALEAFGGISKNTLLNYLNL